jgi:hypothetical protein
VHSTFVLLAVEIEDRRWKLEGRNQEIGVRS